MPKSIAKNAEKTLPAILITTTACYAVGLCLLAAWFGRGSNAHGPWALAGFLLMTAAYLTASAAAYFIPRALVAQQDEDLRAANATLRVAALGREEDGRRILLYRHLVDQLPIGVLVLRIAPPTDPGAWRIVEMNPAGQRMAASAESAVGKALSEFAPEILASDFPRLCLECLNSSEPRMMADFVSSQRVPGAHFSIQIFPLGGPLVGIIVQNVTLQVNAKDALTRSNLDLSQFAYVASHDLQEPLRKATAFAEQIAIRLEKRMDDADRDFMLRLQRSLSGMQNLIDALLTLARVSAGGAKTQTVDLAAVAADVVDGLDLALTESEGEVRIGPLPTIMADPQQMRQLLQNLIGNAIKFHHRGRPPRVRVGGRMLGEGFCEIDVADEGVGFDMKFAGRIFQPFQRLHGRKDFPGSGMGLAICQKIVARHGGTITVDSAVDRGTRFKVLLPVGRAGVDAQAAAAGGGSWNKE